MEDPRQLERRLRLAEHQLRLHRVGLALCGGVIIALLGLLLLGKTPRLGRAILINDRVVAMVKNEKAAAAVRERLLRARGNEAAPATFREKWEDATRPVEGADVLSIAEAVKLLQPKVTVVVEACAIEANGQQLLVAPSREVAEGLLSKLKVRYASQSDAVVRSVRLQPAPVLRPVTVPPAEIVSDIPAGVERLASARAAQQVYVVAAGDYPERIADRHQMGVSELYRLNPGLRGSTLRVGQKVKVLGPGLGLRVVTVKETTSTDLIPPPVQRTRTATLAKGALKTTSPGQPGKKRVRWEVIMHNEREVSRRALSQEIIAAPSPRQILVGAG